jgi:PAS domain S-box-containing protein
MSLNTPVVRPRTPQAAAPANEDSRFAALVDQMVDGLFVSDAAGHYVDVNRAGCEMLGYTRDELLRLSIADVVAGEEIVRVDPEVKRLAGGDVVRSEWRFRRKDGSVFIGEVLGRQLPDGRLQAILRDVSGSRAVESRLREAEQRHRVALAAAELGTWFHDIAEDTIRLDAQAQALTGIAMERVPAAVVFAQFHPDDAARMNESIAMALDPQRSSALAANDFRIVVPDGSVRWLRVHAHIEFAGSGAERRPARVIGTMEDITSRRLAQERLTRLSRAYETRSEINKCVARAMDEYELLSGACRVVVEYSGFKWARAVSLDPTAVFPDPPVHYGPAADLADCPAIAEWLRGDDLRARLCAVLRRNGHRLATEIVGDEFLACQNEACADAGIRAACILPLAVEEKLVGAMAVYSASADSFDADTVRLLEEMAADVSFGLASLAEARRMHESEQRFFTIFRTSPDCILIIRMSDECVADANDGFLRTFEYRRDDVVGKTVHELELWDSDEARSSLLAVLERDGRIRDFEALWRRRSGERCDCLVSAEIVMLGGMRHLSCVVTDVTERRAIDRLLHAREQEFRALAENSPDIISRFDRNARRVYANRELSRCFGVSLNDVLGKTPLEGMPGSGVARQIQEAVEAVIATAQETELDISANEGVGAQLVHRHVRMVPEFDTAGTVVSVLAIARDITRLKLTKQRLRETQQQLRELDARREHAREDERKRMAREIHDVLGQMLTALRLDLDMLGMEFGAEQPMLLERTAKSMHLVDETIAVVRNLASALRPPVLDMGIVSALDWLAREFTGHSGVACDVAVLESEIGLDEEQATNVFRIVQESLTNVARHARAGRVHVALRRNGDGYELSIADDGAGFDPDAVTKRSFGLVGMRERAAMLGGELTAQSRRGAGTRIVARFPATRDEETP